MKSGHKQGPPQKLEAQEKTQGTAPGRKRDHTIVISGPETYVEPKAPREQHLPDHLEPLWYREETEREEVGEAPEGVKRANVLRYKEDLGMAKKERQVTRELIEDPTRRRSVPYALSGGVAYEVGGVTIEKLIAANKELKVWQGKLVRATADLINVIKKAEEGLWKTDSGLKEEA